MNLLSHLKPVSSRAWVLLGRKDTCSLSLFFFFKSKGSAAEMSLSSLQAKIDALKNSPLLLPSAITAIVVYFASLCVYRLYFHPLSKFPGPKLAAITRYYEAYYDVALNGQYTFKIRELHKKYGRDHPNRLSSFVCNE